MRSARTCLPLVLLAWLAGCSDQREAAVRQQLQQQIATQSGGALALSSFAKTNGYEQSIAGLQLYTLEWQARLAVQADMWKGGNAFVGYWSDFGVMRAQPGMWDNLVSGGAAKEYIKGATVVLTGQTQLQKTEKGWRVLAVEVKTSQTLNNERSPAALAELQRQRDSVMLLQQQAQAAADSQSAALAAAEASEKEEAAKRHEALVSAARSDPTIIGQSECIEHVQGSGDRFPTVEYRTYRFVVTSAGVTRELINVTGRYGPAWSKPNGQRDVIWFDQMVAKPAYYRGSRSALDRVITMQSDGPGAFDLYCSGNQDSRTPADDLEKTFTLLTTALDAWKMKNPSLARW